MLRLAMDTSYKNLVLGLYEDGKILGGFNEEAPKKQSEMIFVKLDELLKKSGKKLKDVDEIVITTGPGSYTGLRIAMSIAKVLASQSKASLYTINTMQLQAGMQEANVLLDARGHRAYAAHIKDGKTEWMGILDLDEIPAFLNKWPGKVIGDGHLAGFEDTNEDLVSNFLELEPVYEETEHIHTLVPLYLKESDAYKV